MKQTRPHGHGETPLIRARAHTLTGEGAQVRLEGSQHLEEVELCADGGGGKSAGRRANQQRRLKGRAASACEHEQQAVASVLRGGRWARP